MTFVFNKFELTCLHHLLKKVQIIRVPKLLEKYLYLNFSCEFVKNV